MRFWNWFIIQCVRNRFLLFCHRLFLILWNLISKHGIIQELHDRFELKAKILHKIIFDSLDSVFDKFDILFSYLLEVVGNRLIISLNLNDLILNKINSLAHLICTLGFDYSSAFLYMFRLRKLVYHLNHWHLLVVVFSMNLVLNYFLLSFEFI